MLTKFAVADEAAALTEFWSQRVLATANGNLLKVAKGTRSTNWHTHDDQDETFLLLAGELTIQLRDGDVHLTPGDLLVIPRGVEHCPIADGEVLAMLIEPAGVVNTGGAGGPLTAVRDDSLLG